MINKEKMKIVCLIDGLGLGGAQRQIIGLVKGLKSRGHEACLVYYCDSNFYYNYAIAQGIDCFGLKIKGSRMSKIIGVHSFINSKKPDVLISYIDGANVIACLYKLFHPKVKVIISERNTTQYESRLIKLQYCIYNLANYVVPNSISQLNYIKCKHPKLGRKAVAITNFTDTDSFVVKDRMLSSKKEILTVGRIGEQKNVLRYIEAVKIVHERTNVLFTIKWVGNIFDDEYYNKCLKLIYEYKLQDIFKFSKTTNSVIDEYETADYFCLPSIYEGFPNVLCEALSCGLPVACSDVCDNPTIVEHGINGYLFNPLSTTSIAEGLISLLNLEGSDYLSMSIINREKAVCNLSIEGFITKYENLF